MKATMEFEENTKGSRQGPAVYGYSRASWLSSAERGERCCERWWSWNLATSIRKNCHQNLILAVDRSSVKPVPGPQSVWFSLSLLSCSSKPSRSTTSLTKFASFESHEFYNCKSASNCSFKTKETIYQMIAVHTSSVGIAHIKYLFNRHFNVARPY